LIGEIYLYKKEFDMSLILEQIIRHILLEQRTVAKIKQISNKEWATAKAAGAVHAYAVKVKGTSNSAEIKELVQAATLASVGGETDDSVSVGGSSKYATEKYEYVMSDPKSEKRQRINVWIMPALAHTSKDDEDGFTVTANKQFRIGQSVLTLSILSLVSEYNERAELFKKPKINNLKTSEDTEEDQSKKSDPNSTTGQDTDNPFLKKSEPADATKKITYPYEWETKERGLVDVYTLNDADTNVYTFNDKDQKWYQMNKTEFEQRYNTGKEITTEIFEVSDPDLIAKLNKLANIEPIDSQNKEKLPVTEPEKKKNTPTEPENKKTPPKEKTYKSGDKIKLNSTKVYQYKNGTFEHIQDYKTDSSVIKYISKSKNGKYAYVEFPGSKKYWVPVSSIK